MTQKCNLISYKRCGIQYIAETSQALRSTTNNHKDLDRCDLFLYQHFCLDGHSEDDIAIMPIEKVSFKKNTYGYKDLATIYPHGLNDNVRKVGNISKITQ